jgi:redox-sensitive bicupin YhaK (pirin superfamily)
MTQATATLAPAAARSQHRKIVYRTRGTAGGPITRLMSPGDLGEVLKPFVFLDRFELEKASFSGMNVHPHSGIATLTYVFEGSVRYEDTTGATGVLPAGGVEWFKAGHGAWHGGGLDDDGRARGFQLWLALSPEHELGPVESIYLAPEAVPQEGAARVLLGAYGAAASPLAAPAPVNYLAVRLRAGESWLYRPPTPHKIAWMAVGLGRVATPAVVEAGEMAVFEPSNGEIEFKAYADTDFVIGSAIPHPHDLILGHYSVHSNPAALEAGERRINEIGSRLRREGRLKA